MNMESGGQSMIVNFFDRYHPQDRLALRPLATDNEPLYNESP